MNSEMTDEEFLAYCSAHATTERAGFVPAQIVRLLELAGEAELAARWRSADERRIVSIYSDEIEPLVISAIHALQDKDQP